MKYSINTKLFLIFSILIFSLVSLIFLLNSTMLETYYLHKKQKNLINLYNDINYAYSTSENGIEALTSTFEKLEANRNIDLVIKSSTGSTIYVTSKDYSSDRMFFNQNILLSKSYIEEKLSNGVTYFVEKYYDNFLSSDFLMLIGKLNDDSYIFLRSPLESIREGIKTSNTFLFITGMIILVLSSGLAFFISKRFTKPIYELNAITKKMSNLDFSTKYTVTSDDEIGMLGNSINSLSENLENKIKELREANMELEKDIEETSKIVEMRSQFISDVSHELKTPISLIQGYAEGLADGVVTDEESKKYYVDVILDEANKMSQLTRGLLDLSNLEYGKNDLQIREFDITNLISSTIKKNELILKEKNITLEFDDSKHYNVLGDMFRIEQVITNYLNNAIKNIAGERKIKIFEEEKENNIIRINVSNTGKNIAEEDLPRIWVRFYKVDNSRNREVSGSGIGLSLVRAIMNQHKNKYGVENTEDGVNFYFELNKADDKAVWFISNNERKRRLTGGIDKTFIREVCQGSMTSSSPPWQKSLLKVLSIPPVSRLSRSLLLINHTDWD